VRTGKLYRYVQPTALAPNMPEYKGLPLYAYARVSLQAGEFFYGDQQKVRVPSFNRNLAHGAVQYAWEVTNVPVRTGCKWQIFVRQDSPAVRHVIGVVANDGSSATVEKSAELSATTGGTAGRIILGPPWDTELFFGLYTGITFIELDPVPYHEEL
jgi:hypothetical protein